MRQAARIGAKMPEELFRTAIVSRDPRYPLIITLCNYCLAALFLGMLLTLSGVTLTNFSEQQQHSQDVDVEKKSKFAKVFGLFLLIVGCLCMISSLVILMVASLLYLKTTTTSPTNQQDETEETVWSYLDNLPDKLPREGQTISLSRLEIASSSSS